MGTEIRSATDLLKILEEAKETYQRDKELHPLAKSILGIEKYIKNPPPDIKGAPEYNKAKEIYDGLMDLCLGV